MEQSWNCKAMFCIFPYSSYTCWSGRQPFLHNDNVMNHHLSIFRLGSDIQCCILFCFGIWVTDTAQLKIETWSHEFSNNYLYASVQDWHRTNYQMNPKVPLLEHYLGISWLEVQIRCWDGVPSIICFLGRVGENLRSFPRSWIFLRTLAIEVNFS